MGIRSQIRNRVRFAPDSVGHGGKTFAWICFFSLVSHLIFFAVVFWLQDFDFLPPKPRVVRVDLVSFAPGPVAESVSEPTQPAPIKSPEAGEESVSTAVKSIPKATSAPAPIPVLKPELSLKSKPKNLKALMAARKETEKPVQKKKDKKPLPPKKTEQELEKARQALAQKVEKQNKDQIDQALKRIQAAIEKQKKQTQKGGGVVSGNGSGGQGNSPLTLYQMGMKSAFQQNWVFNDAMAGLNQNLEVKIFIKILKNGEIRDISYETRSGNQYLDESAKKAIRRASPLPELPKGMASYELVVGFTPKGLK